MSDVIKLRPLAGAAGLLAWLLITAPAFALSSTPKGDPRDIAAQAIASANAIGDESVAGNKSASDEAVNYINQAFRNGSSSTAREVAFQYRRMINKQSHDARRAILRIRALGLQGVRDNGGSRDLVRQVQQATDEQLTAVELSNYAAVHAIEVALRG